jgi:hypothetical protein
MKYLTLGFAVLLLALAGCSDGNPVGVDATTLDAQTLTVAAKNEVKMVPLKGTWDFMPNPDAAPVPCVDPLGNPVPFAFPTGAMTAMGNVTHLGKTTSVITLDACTVYPDGSLQGPGTFTHTGANGDAIYGTYVGVIYPDGTLSFDPDVADPPIVIMGGTGRFDGATGWAVGGGMVDIGTGGTFWIEGMISSVGSIK